MSYHQCFTLIPPTGMLINALDKDTLKSITLFKWIKSAIGWRVGINLSRFCQLTVMDRTSCLSEKFSLIFKLSSIVFINKGLYLSRLKMAHHFESNKKEIVFTVPITTFIDYYWL
jgi:hypothetical protein